MTVCRIDKKEGDLGFIRLLVDEVHIASDYLDKLLQQGWEGEFPIPRTKYISVPSEIAFYEQLMGMLTPRQAVWVATQLRDASYMEHVAQRTEEQTSELQSLMRISCAGLCLAKKNNTNKI